MYARKHYLAMKREEVPIHVMSWVVKTLRQVKTDSHKGHILYDFIYMQGPDEQVQRNRG